MKEGRLARIDRTRRKAKAKIEAKQLINDFLQTLDEVQCQLCDEDAHQEFWQPLFGSYDVDTFGGCTYDE